MTRNNEIARAVHRALVMSAIAAVGASSLPARAQTADESAQTVTVTGSRIQRQDYEATSPVVTVGAQALQQAGTVQIDTVLNTLPQLVPSVTTTSNNPGNGGQANVDLRGLGTQRTLVLLNGTRLTPSNTSGEIDLNTIPAALIENIELLTGGASSVYGSDAIAGVVNVVLKKNFQGAQLTAMTGETGERDGKTLAVDMLLGGNFADDRGNAVLALSYDDRNAVFQGARSFSNVTRGPDFSAQGSSTTPEGRYDRSLANLPSQAVVNQVFGRYGVAAGAVEQAGNLGFNADRSLFDFEGTDHFTGDTSDPGFNPDAFSYNFAPINYLQLPLTRRQVAGFGNLNLGEKAETYARLIYTTYTADVALAATPVTGLSVPMANPNIPADLRTILDSRTNRAANFTFRKRVTEVGPRISGNNYDVVNALLGFKGDFAIAGQDWSWDVFGSWGQMTKTEQQSGNVSFSRIQNLLDGTDITGCTAAEFNPFGNGSINANCAQAIAIRTTNITDITQDNFVGSMTGGLFDLPAGLVQMAIGAEYRNTGAAFRPDEFLASGDVVGFNKQAPVNGRIDVTEEFLEFAVPLLKDIPAIKSLDLELGFRHSEYNLAGSADTYKSALNWQATDSLKFRTSFNHAIRAPSVFELFLPPTENFPGYVDPCNGPAEAGDPDPRTAQVLALCRAQIGAAFDNPAVRNGFQQTNSQTRSILSGNAHLSPEAADTFTLGAVWQTEFGDQRLRTSIDYWNYSIEDTIDAVSAASAVARCFNDAGANPTYDPNNVWCARFRRDDAGDVADIQQPTENLGALKINGVDLQVDYGTPLGESLGKLNVNLLLTRVLKWDFQEDSLSPFGHFKGTVTTALGENYPEWKAVLNLGWSMGKFDVNWNTRYVDAVQVVNDDATGTPVTSGVKPTVPTFMYHRLTGSWHPTDAINLTLGVDNVFDKQPPIYTDDAQAGVQANTDPSTYDVLGRRFFLFGQYKF